VCKSTWVCVLNLLIHNPSRRRRTIFVMPWENKGKHKESNDDNRDKDNFNCVHFPLSLVKCTRTDSLWTDVADNREVYVTNSMEMKSETSP